MAFDFPNSPTVGQQYASGGVTYVWSGIGWVQQSAAGTASVAYVDAQDALRVLKSGDTMTGLLLLSADPAAALGAVTKQYVDNRVVRYDAAQALTVPQKEQTRSNINAAPFDALAYNNLVINGSMEVSQQFYNNAVILNTVGGNVASADCWFANSLTTGSLVLTVQQVIPPGLPFGVAFPGCLYLRATTGQASLGNGDYAFLGQNIEGYRTSRLMFGWASAQPVTIGFWVAAQVPGTMTVAIRNSAADRSYLANVTINFATNWEYKTVTIPADTIGTWLGGSAIGLRLAFCFGAGSDYRGTNAAWNAGNKFATAQTTNFFASTNNAVFITCVTVLPGNEALPSDRVTFSMRPFDQELALCQRYYCKSFDYITPPAQNAGVPGAVEIQAQASGGNLLSYFLSFPALGGMLFAPTLTTYNPNAANNSWRDVSSNVDVTSVVASVSHKGAMFYANGSVVLAHTHKIHWSASAKL